MITLDFTQQLFKIWLQGFFGLYVSIGIVFLGLILFRRIGKL